MRINFKSASVPTRAAKRLKAALSLKESTAREWTARVYGYRTWHDLLQSLGSVAVSPLDEECSSEEVRARRRYQTAQLQACLTASQTPSPLSAAVLIDTWQPSAGHPDKEVSVLQRFAHPERAAAAMLGMDRLFKLQDLSEELLTQMPARDADLLGREACLVARRLMNKGDETEKRFARSVLEELHARGSSAGTLHLGVSILLGTGGAADRPRAEELFQLLAFSPDTPDNIRVAAADGLETIKGAGDGWPADITGALATWEQRALEGSAHYAYRTALAYDRFKPATQEVRSDLAKAVRFYRMAAERGHGPAAGCLSFLLSGNDDLSEYLGESEYWRECAARGGDKLAQELETAVDAAVAQLAALPLAVATAQVLRMVERHLPKAQRGDAELDVELGEMVLLPHSHWVQLSTGFLFERVGTEFRRIEGSYLAPGVVAEYPRGADKALERLAWVQHHGELLERCRRFAAEKRADSSTSEPLSLL
jgi:hypothetical protein